MDTHVELFQALGDATRLRLVNLLMQTGEICVCEIVDALELPQYNISRHLQILLKAGWLEDRKVGKWVYYRIARELKACQRSVLRAIDQMRDEREDFRQDEKRASRRLKLRRDGLCCVGLVPLGDGTREPKSQSDGL
jgi:ArsR family transcriptional regulator, arsenate/arsenite/antimonite-responsive transcriptional repressor